MTGRRADTECTKPCSTASICLAAALCQQLMSPRPVGLVAHWDRAPPLQPLYAGLFAEWEESLAVWASLQHFALLLLLLFPFFHTLRQRRTSSLPAVPVWEQLAPFISHHLRSRRAHQVSCMSCGTQACLWCRVLWCDSSRQAGGAAWWAPRELRGRGTPAAQNGTQRSPPFALQDRALKQICPCQGQSLPVPLSAICWVVTAETYPVPPPQGGGSVVGVAMGKKLDVSVPLISHPHEGHLCRFIHHSHLHPSPQKYMGKSSRREQGPTIQDYATEGDNSWEW